MKDIKPCPTAFKEIYKIVGKFKYPFCQELKLGDVTLTNSFDIAQQFQE